MCTHEEYINAVRAIAAARIGDAEFRAKIAGAKLIYGSGDGARGRRGVTMFDSWKVVDSCHALAEVCALGEENPVQLAGTTLHELGHVLAGRGCGHNKEWKLACESLGLLNAKAVGHAYLPESFDADAWALINALEKPTDGIPQAASSKFTGGKGGCHAGVGVKGGKSRGTGSGSRLRLWECKCNPPVKVRVASDGFHAHCDECNQAFTQEESKPRDPSSGLVVLPAIKVPSV